MRPRQFEWRSVIPVRDENYHHPMRAPAINILQESHLEVSCMIPQRSLFCMIGLGVFTLSNVTSRTNKETQSVR